MHRTRTDFQPDREAPLVNVYTFGNPDLVRDIDAETLDVLSVNEAGEENWPFTTGRGRDHPKTRLSEEEGIALALDEARIVGAGFVRVFRQQREETLRPGWMDDELSHVVRVWDVSVPVEAP